MVTYLRDLLPHAAPFQTRYKPLWFHKAGLSQTATGYGKRITSSRVLVLPDGTERRIYVTQYSNAGTAWVNYKGQSFVVVSDCDLLEDK
jgi:hypothetical protein